MLLFVDTHISLDIVYFEIVFVLSTGQCTQENSKKMCPPARFKLVYLFVERTLI